MTKQQRLDQIRADIVSKNICPDLANTAKNLVFGSGNIDAKILFIGEAPGKKEDETGEPFVGAAGKFLDQMLLSINLQRSDIYITNIVKFRPPENRDPSVAEKEAFLPYLYAQLEVISPKVVVTLGRHSTNCFLPGLQIGDIHGQPQRIKLVTDNKAPLSHEPFGGQRMDGARGNGEKQSKVYRQYSERVSEPLTKRSAMKHPGVSGLAGNDGALSLIILPLYHPAAALYNGGLRQTLMEDFAKIPQLLMNTN